MAKETRKSLWTPRSVLGLVAELIIYVGFVWGYYWVVLHTVGASFKQVFDHHKLLYAFLALAVVVVQAVLLELVTAVLSRVLRGKTD